VTRLLYILPGLVPPGEDASRDKFTYLSEVAEGEVLLPVWWNSSRSAPPYLQPTFPVYRVGSFRYHLFPAFRAPKFLQRIAISLFYIRRGWQLHREKKVDVIVAYGTNRPGIVAVILKWITGAKMIVEVPGIPENAFRYDARHPGLGSFIKRFFANACLLFVGSFSDCLKLLYPTQLQKYPLLKAKRAVVFHDFVPVHSIREEPTQELFVLSVGYPWYTKGMDVVIRAFKSIASQFPECKLKLMGYFPDRGYLDELAAGCSQIEFLPGRPNELALQVIGACSVYVLASRTEAMGRVLLEAMAARKPIIASAIGGVPSYISENENGILFQSENVEELAAKLAILLSNNALRARLANRAYQLVTTEFDETAYVSSFKNMLDSLVGCDRSGMPAIEPNEQRSETILGKT
jgi:glycosyltransferase involved in cell wall biosynthesis